MIMNDKNEEKNHDIQRNSYDDPKGIFIWQIAMNVY